MKYISSRISVLFATVMLPLSALQVRAADEPQSVPATKMAEDEMREALGNPPAEIKTVLESVGQALAQSTEADRDKIVKDAVSKLDVLVEKWKSDQPKLASQAIFYKLSLYAGLAQDMDLAKKQALLLKSDFAQTPFGQAADKFLEEIDMASAQMQHQKEMDAKFAIGNEPPAFAVKDLSGKPLSLEAYKGKVVLVDFWATWCGPCVGEIPHVVDTYKAHHDKGFEVIGISLDQNEASLRDFIGKHEMVWSQYFDGKGWGNEVAQLYGIQAIPATFLLNREGKIIGRDLRGDALESAVAEALKE